jgi:hypothetical protein
MSEPSTQWHPIFTYLLRTLVEDHYEVQTNLPVGDLPREADIVLVRRTSDRPPPFRTLLHYLTTWNIIEFKGRTVSARFRDIDLLVELGLGVDRKLNEDRTNAGTEPLGPEEVSFWYIVNHFGDRFLEEARAALGTLEEASPGVWRSQILRRPVFLIDSAGVTVDRESVAVHLVGEESPQIEQELARVIALEPAYWVRYGGFLATSHPKILEETRRMATANAKPGDIDLHPLIEMVGQAKVAEALGLEAMIKAMGVESVLAKLSADLPPEKQKQARELFGLKEPT